MKELIDHARANPGKVTFGHAGIGSQTHLAAENFVWQAKIDALAVPYKGEGPGLAASIAGETTFFLGNVAAAIGHIQGGRLRALGVTSKGEAAQLPGVPPIGKTIPGFENTGWFGLVAPDRHAEGHPAEGLRRHQEGARGERPARTALRAGTRAGRQYAGGDGARDEGGKRALGAGGEGAQDRGEVKVDLAQVEEAAKELYIRALKELPPDIKQRLRPRSPPRETDAGAKRMLGTMMRNITVAEDTNNLLCQDTGIPVYNVWIGRGVEVDGAGLKDAIRRGCARSTQGVLVPLLDRASDHARERAELDRARRAGDQHRFLRKKNLW